VLALTNDSYINGNKLNLNGGMLNLMNGATGTVALNSLTLAAGTTTNLGIDMNLANATSDRITAATYGNAGTLNISNINLLSDRSGTTTVSVVDPALSSSVTSSVTSIMGPIYKYNFNYESSTGNMVASAPNGGDYTDYNPVALSKPVASLTGTYLQQVNTYTEALGRSEIFMSLPQNERMLMKNQNKYAYAGNDQMVFSPTMLPEAKGGLWCKQYTSFENVPLSNGPRVSSVGYGALVGGDTPLTYLGQGYDGYLTAYAGYNGSHQNYGNVGINQNGGTVGLTGTVYKGNFFAALTANVGAMLGEANAAYGNDYFNTLVAGAALKTGYNFELMRGKLILQPSLSVSYTFANTFDYTTAAGVNVTSEPLNAIQVTPGIKLIGNLKNGWQPYLATNMVWNIMDSQKIYANDVQLPQMSVDPYVEYGFGVQRRWGDRLTGFGQSMFRGGGRNGVAFQFGLRYSLGK
jgi:outer membrane autotransporter protein